MAAGEFDRFILTDDGTVKFDFMTSLQNIAVAKIVNYLWMNENRDIVRFIHSGIRPGRRESSDSWKQIKNNIADKISSLPLPKSVSDKLNNILGIVGNSILKWIRYHECIFNTNKYSAVDQINNIAWTARGKIDYAQTAKNIVADKYANLCDDEKYKLACAYCLEDQIAVLAPKVVNEYYLDSVQIHMHPMVYFWTAHITGDNTQLYDHYRHFNKLNNIGINGYIIQLLINSNQMTYKTFNEVPIKYMWRLLNNEEKAKNVSLLIKILSNQELRYTLLSSLDFELQKEVFKECSNAILLDLFNDWSWEEYFLPTALHILDEMQPSDYSFILHLVRKEMTNNFQEKNHILYKKYAYIFKKLWQEGSRDLKDFIIENGDGYSFETFLFQLLRTGETDVTDILLKDLNTKKNRHVVFSYSSFNYCAYLIMKYEWGFLEKFIKYTISSEEDVNFLKVNVLNCHGCEIAAHFLEDNEFDKIEHFMNWTFKSEKEIDTFRKSLAFIKCEATLESALSSNDIDFTNLENRFKWCAKGDVEVINEVKTKIAKSYSEILMRNLIEDDKYELLDQFLNWCFLANPIEISHFKSLMYKDANLVHFLESLIVSLIKKDNSLKTLQKFVDWSFTNSEDEQEFKNWLLYPTEKYGSLCTVFLTENQFDLADKFIKWCVTATEEIQQFKNMLLLSKDFSLIKGPHDYYNVEPCLPLLINWFNPSKELVDVFQKTYPPEKCPDNFYDLLEEFLHNRNSLAEKYTRLLNKKFENSQNEDSVGE